MPRLTVLMPVRNGERTVGRAVRSTLADLPRDSELLVFDDASTDDTAGTLAMVRDDRLRVIHSAQPTGVAGGLNTLLAHSDSEFVGRMDADDICLRGRFVREARAMASMDVAFTTVVEFTDGTRIFRPNPPRRLGPAAFPLHLLLTNPVAHPTMFARRVAISDVDGYREVPAEDYDLWIRLAVSGAKLGRLALPGIAYRAHAGQVTLSQGWRLASWRNRLVAEAFEQLSERLLGRPLSRLTTMAVDETLDGQRFEESLTEFARAITLAATVLSARDRRRLLMLLGTRLGAVRDIREHNEVS